MERGGCGVGRGGYGIWWGELRWVGEEGGGGYSCHVMHGRSRKSIDPRIPTMPGRSTSGCHH